MTETLRIIPLGGLGEIGKNTLLFEYDRDILVVDAGIMFPGARHVGHRCRDPRLHLPARKR